VVNYETPPSEYSLTMTAGDSYASCGPFESKYLRKMLKGSGTIWRSPCKKVVPHTFVIEPRDIDCVSEDWSVRYLIFKIRFAKKVEVYVGDEKILDVSFLLQASRQRKMREVFFRARTFGGCHRSKLCLLAYMLDNCNRVLTRSSKRPANFQQTSSNTFDGSLLDVCWIV